MRYKNTQHSYNDADLITAKDLSRICGVSAPAISKAKDSNRIDSFDNSEGKERFHRTYSAKQFFKSRDRRHVTTPTQAQMRSGFDNMTAQAVAHRPEFDSGDDVPPVLLDEDAPFDLGDAIKERVDLTQSKALKEFYQARYAKLRTDEMENRLVPKAQAAIAAYQLGANVQDKIMTIYSWLAPEIVGYFKEQMAKSGVTADVILVVTGDADHYIGEKIRKACLTALKDLTEKTEENILDG